MIELRELLSRLQGVEEKGGGQFMARCPCHDDKRASLAVRMGEKGIVLNCLAHCETADILDALGLSWADVTLPEHWQTGKGAAKGAKRKAAKAEPASAAPASASAPKQRTPADLNLLKVGGSYVHKSRDENGNQVLVRETITRCYDYQDERGTVVLKVFRTEEKSFPVIHYADGGWWWGDGGRIDLLYRLPKIKKAAAAGETVWVVEGEKDVETLEGLGLVATCNKGGAGKWPEACTRALAGARVVICPDVDEPGRKHGRLVARQLEGVAKEVRLVNLRRAEGVTLPDKGDVSDLKQALGKGTLRVLEQLQARAPVLSRRVSDADYEEFFDGIKGCKVQNGCICTFTSGDWVPISNFVALPIEEALLDDGNGDAAYRVKVVGWSSLGTRLRPLTMNMDVFGRMDWPLAAWGLSANISEAQGAKAKLRRIIQAAGLRAAVHRTVYSHTGWREVDGKLCFLHGTGAIGAEDVDVMLDYSFDRYSIEGLRSGPWMEEPPEVRRVLCMGAALRAMEVGTLRLGVPLTGYMFLCPLRHFLVKRGHRPSFIPFLRGQSQSGKSAFAAFMLNYFGYDWSYESSMPANFENTGNSIGLKLFTLKDLPLLVDDYHPQSDAQKAKSMAAVAESISRMIGDGAVRDRMRADGTAQTMKPIRALCIETGEETPRVSASSVGRMYVIDVQPGDVPIPRRGMNAAQQRRSEEYMELLGQARHGALNEVMRGYIEWLLSQADTLPDRLDELLTELRREALARMDEETKGRTATSVSYLMLGVRMLLEYLASPGGLLTPDLLPEMMERYWATITGTAEEQNQEMRMESPSETFITTVRELLQSGRCVVRDTTGPAVSTSPVKDMIGYRDEAYYYLIPGETFGAVQRALDAQGASLTLTKAAVLRILAQEGKILRDEKANKNVRQYNRGGVRCWMIWMPRWVLDGTDPKLREKQLTVVDTAEESQNPFAGGKD